MKKLLLSAAAVLAIATAPGLAADLTIPDTLPPVEPIVAGPSWTSFYIGVQGGAALFDQSIGDPCDGLDSLGLLGDVLSVTEDFDAGIDPIGDDSATLDYPDFDCEDIDFDASEREDFTWIAGGHVGADVQYGMFVAGVVADANWIDDDGESFEASFDPDSTIAGSATYAGFGFDASLPGFPDVVTISSPDFDAAEEGAPYQEFSAEHQLEWYSTARVRAGIAPGGGRFLIYATGGAAFGEAEWSASHTAVFTGDEADRYFANQGGAPAGDDEYAPGGPLPDGCEELVATGGNPPLNATGVVCSQSASDDEFLVGFAAGGGVDFLATDHFSLGAEALFVNLGSPDFNLSDDDLDFVTVTLRGSLRFGGGMFGGS